MFNLVLWSFVIFIHWLSFLYQSADRMINQVFVVYLWFLYISHSWGTWLQCALTPSLPTDQTSPMFMKWPNRCTTKTMCHRKQLPRPHRTKHSKQSVRSYIKSNKINRLPQHQENSVWYCYNITDWLECSSLCNRFIDKRTEVVASVKNRDYTLA